MPISYATENQAVHLIWAREPDFASLLSEWKGIMKWWFMSNH